MATISEVLQRGVQWHQHGNLAEAERLYRQVLEVDARNPDAWHLLGLVAHARGDHAAALELISRAIKLDGGQASFQNHLGEVYRALKRFPEAEASARQALQFKPDWAVAHNSLGLALAEQGKLEQALASFWQALHHQPDLVQAYCNLGMALQATGQLAESVAAYRKAIEFKSDYAFAYNQLGMALRDLKQDNEAAKAFRQALRFDPCCAQAENNLGQLFQSQSKLDEAEACYQRALRIQPESVEALCNLGSVWSDRKQYPRAIECYQRALQQAPRLIEALFSLGVIYQGLKQLPAAVEYYQQALQIQPDNAKVLSNLGTVYRAMDRLDEAMACYQRALEFEPDLAETICNLGNIFKEQGRFAEAEVCYVQALRIKPEYALARFNYAVYLLLIGNLARGWAEYESRWKSEDFPRHGFTQPAWRGEPLEKRALLVHAEQGLGDTLHFARYVKLINAQGGKVFFEIPKALQPLLKQSNFSGLIAKGAPLPNFDLHAPLLSLPGVLGTTLENIPAQVPYLSADPALVESWRRSIRATPGFKVGIAWQGSTTYPGDRFRSIPLACFTPLALAGVELISLQKGAGSEQAAELADRFPVTELGSSFDREHGPFMDTAALMKNLDLVITSDTSVAHLAGALGVPVWVALPFSPDWRWLLDREDSPWYPTMRLFRQTRFDHWPPVFERIADELRRKVANPA